MIHLHDAGSMAHALSLHLDPRLRALLTQRIDALTSGDFDLTSDTEFLVIAPGDTEADIIRHVGFSPLIEPIEGARFGDSGFHPFWDYLVAHDGWYEMIVTFGSAFAYVLLIEDAPTTLPPLLALCKRYSGAQP